MSVKTQLGETLPQLVSVMKRLLGEGGCPWDRTQTLAAIRKYTIEEAFEVADAIDALGAHAETTVQQTSNVNGDAREVRALREELGDLLLQVVFQSELAATWGWFTVDDVVQGIAEKMVRRHPHVFGDAKVEGVSQVLANWEALKASEKKSESDAPRGTLDGLPKGLPTLLHAYRLGEKAANVGFDWPDAQGPREKLGEEIAEWDEAVRAGDRDAMAHELGDVLFSVANVARKNGLDPDDCLRKANARFRARFNHVESTLRAKGREVKDASLDEMNAAWDEAKKP